MIDKIKEFVKKLNENGVPLPMLRDPVNGKSSVSLTMMFIAFNINIAGLIGKLSGFLGEVDLGGANTLFITTAGLYFARRINTKKGDQENVLENKEGETK